MKRGINGIGPRMTVKLLAWVWVMGQLSPGAKMTVKMATKLKIMTLPNSIELTVLHESMMENKVFKKYLQETE